MVPHTVIVDFAVALLITSVICDGLASLAQERDLVTVATWTLVFGTVSAALAVLSGYAAAAAAAATGEALEVVTWHRNTGIGTLVCFLPAATWRFVAGGPPRTTLAPVYWLLTGAGLILLMTTAYLGGSAVFRHGVGVGIQ